MGKVGERDDWAGDRARHLPELVALHRDIHRHSELGFDVQRTADLVAQRLAASGIAVHRGLAKTGVVGTLTGRAAGDRSIALRADMDALAIAEETDRPHSPSYDFNDEILPTGVAYWISLCRQQLGSGAAA